MLPCFPSEVDATCSDFDFGTALHISAANLCTAAVRCLLELGANPAFRVRTTRKTLKEAARAFINLRHVLVWSGGTFVNWDLKIY